MTLFATKIIDGIRLHLVHQHHLVHWGRRWGLAVLADKSSQITGSIDSLTEQSKSNYSNITASITEVSDKTDDMISTLAEVSAVLHC